MTSNILDDVSRIYIGTMVVYSDVAMESMLPPLIVFYLKKRVIIHFFAVLALLNF